MAVFLAARRRRLPADWFDALRRDELGPFTIDCDRFTLSSYEQARQHLRDAATTHALVGTGAPPQKRPPGAVVAFWAGPVGFFGIAHAMHVFNMQGQVQPRAIKASHARWWEYWWEYWQRKDGPNPLPEDYACDVCIPAGED